MPIFKMDKNKKNELISKVSKHKLNPGPLMPSLHDAQEIFGCVPVEVQKIISKELEIPVSKINGVVTFYSRFSLEPKGKHVVGVCLGTACYVRGSNLVLEEMKRMLHIEVGETSEDGNFTLEATRCIGACGLAPVMTIGEDVIGAATPKTAREALEKVISNEEESK